MSIPIRETPILRGEDSRRFMEMIEEGEKHPVSEEEYNRAKDLYNQMCKINGGDFMTLGDSSYAI